MNIFNSNPTYADDERPAVAGGAETLTPERAQILDRHLARTDAALRRAYARGRRDERARRRGVPVGSGLLLLVALAGLFVVALSIYEGSFTRGGQVVDQHISSATAAAAHATKQAADQAGDAIRNAGDKLSRAAH